MIIWNIIATLISSFAMLVMFMGASGSQYVLTYKAHGAAAANAVRMHTLQMDGPFMTMQGHWAIALLLVFIFIPQIIAIFNFICEKIDDKIEKIFPPKYKSYYKPPF